LNWVCATANSLFEPDQPGYFPARWDMSHQLVISCFIYSRFYIIYIIIIISYNPTDHKGLPYILFNDFHTSEMNAGGSPARAAAFSFSTTVALDVPRAIQVQAWGIAHIVGDSL
jgi:hypothetical protein